MLVFDKASDGFLHTLRLHCRKCEWVFGADLSDTQPVPDRVTSHRRQPIPDRSAI